MMEKVFDSKGAMIQSFFASAHAFKAMTAKAVAALLT
jgi:hypothetical protein